MTTPLVRGKEIYCPRCNDYVRMIRIAMAAELGDVSRRTIYNYIDEGLVYSIKLVGKTYRVCPSCLIRQPDPTADSRA
jgi:hypothetical protein